MNRTFYPLLAVVLALGVAGVSFSSVAFAKGLRVGDVTTDYEGQVVKLEGKVVDTEPRDKDFPNSEGFYTLKDGYGGSIKVWTTKLPTIGRNIRASGTVSIDSETGEPIIRQYMGLWFSPVHIMYAVIVAAAAVVILLVVLVVSAV